MERKLYFGGKILTMDPEKREAEAVLTENGRIAAVGRLSDLKGAVAEKTDLVGKTLMPSFVDGHGHLFSTGMNLTKYCSLDGCEGVEEILERIREFIKTRDLKKGEPITCKGYDLAVMKDPRHPTAADLDRLGRDHPIACIHLSEHVAAYNTVAMEMAGVLGEDYCCPKGGWAGRDENGRLNGYFEETARRPLTPIFSADLTNEDRKKALLAAQDYYLRFGFTTIQEGSANTARSFSVLEALADEGKLKLDTVAYLSADPALSQMRREALESRGKGYKGRLKIGGVKLFLDGSPQVRTAWMRAPYEGEKSYCGYPTLSDEEAEERMRAALKAGLQPIAHCNGDAAAEQFLSRWEKLLSEHPEYQAARPVMIHAQTVGYDQLSRMAKCDMMASFFVGHCFYWGDTHLRNFGERGWRISPVARAIEEKIPYSFHQDSPVTKPDMLHSIWCAVNRKTRNGVCIGEENRISVYDALLGATRGGAYTYFEENEKGILKEGALANFVILGEDPTRVAPEKIKDIPVMSTIREDEVLYQA